MPAYLFWNLLFIVFYYGMRAKNDNIETVILGAIGGGYYADNGPSFLDHTLMVVLLAIPIVILLYGKTGNYNGTTFGNLNLKLIRSKNEKALFILSGIVDNVIWTRN
jgi:hypothetical protein